MANTDFGALLAALPAEEIERALADGSLRLRTYGNNHLLHLSGERCDGVEIVLSGHLVIERIDEAGHLMTVAECLRDDLIGGNLVFSKQPHFPLTITCRRESRLAYLERARLFHWLTSYPDFLQRYLTHVSDHAAALGNRLSRSVNRSIRDAVWAYLEAEMRLQGSRTVRLTMSKKALAERIGVQRTSLSRELAKMRNDGLIAYNARAIDVLAAGGKATTRRNAAAD